MSAVVKFLKEAYGKQTLLESLKAGGWKAALDGNLAYGSALCTVCAAQPAEATRKQSRSTSSELMLCQQQNKDT